MIRPLSLLLTLGLSVVPASADDQPPYRIQLDTVTKGYDPATPYNAEYCWTQPRAAAIPRAGQDPIVLITMQRLKLSGSDLYYAIHEMRSTDLGQTWAGPTDLSPALGRTEEPGGIEACPADMVPRYHVKSGKVLATGLIARYKGDKGVHDNKSAIYAVLDPATNEWSPWQKIPVPPGDLAWKTSAGCTQRVDLPNGDILLPLHYKTDSKDKYWKVRVVRFGFDGVKMTPLEEGNTLRVDTDRGVQEPSLTKFGGRYYLTLRHDKRGYVATSDDGLHFSEPQPWLWDDGSDLGSYNTQTHWVTHRDALYLAYTRRGANNDNVIRHRAPLFLAQVDPRTLRVLRSTEQILMPNKGARYGNFGVANVGPHETWVTDSEWMQQPGKPNIIPVDNPLGAEGRVYAARILWNQPNPDWDKD